MSVYQMTPRELYDAYGNNAPPEKLLTLGRTTIAKRLMADEGLTDREAFFAADQMIELAQKVMDEQQSER